MRNKDIFIFIFIILISLTGCNQFNKDFAPEYGEEIPVIQTFINANGSTIETRFIPPEGYKREYYNPDTFTYFTRNLSLKPDGSNVLLYNGSEKGNQSAHAAVINMEIGDRDLQQCADAVIRLIGEYLYVNGKYDEIGFHLTNGFYLSYNKWKEGYRLVVEGNKTYLTKSANYDASYDTFRKYLNMVFAYAGTLSLENETEFVEDINHIKAGDLFIEGGSPGHAVMVVDIAVDKEGNTAFLLAQSYMPAQEIHILKNPRHKDDPWYYTSEIEFPLKTPQWSFETYCLKTLNK